MSKRKSESPSSCALRLAGLTLAAAAGVVAAGCAPVTTLDGERLAVRSEAFAAYVEEVFREQNRAATSLAFALEDSADVVRLDALEAAEETLLDACAGLNALATTRRDGGRAGAVRGLSAAREAPRCERATADAWAVLEAPDRLSAD